jgi:hypothetical protein
MNIDLIQLRTKYDAGELTAEQYATEIAVELQNLAKVNQDPYLQKLIQWFKCLNCEDVGASDDEMLDGALEELYEWAVLEDVVVLEQEF